VEHVWNPSGKIACEKRVVTRVRIQVDIISSRVTVRGLLFDREHVPGPSGPAYNYLRMGSDWLMKSKISLSPQARFRWSRAGIVLGKKSRKVLTNC
jgi:hypothetical protein